jgi:putative DNA primase/helicase
MTNRRAQLTEWIANNTGTPDQLGRYKNELARLDAIETSVQAGLEDGQILSAEHLQVLQASAIHTDVIKSRGYRTVYHSSDLQALGFDESQCRVPGLLLPLYTTDGHNGLCVYRPDNPLVFEDKTKKKNPDGTWHQKILKYEFPKNQSMRLDCPPVCQPRLADPRVPLWITEGQKKADALASLGLCAIALLGVFNWRGTNELGGKTVLADWECVALKGRDVHIVFDSDIKTNKNIQTALSRLSDWLSNKGARVTAAYLPSSDNRGKTGVDDWLADGHTVSELEALLKEPGHVAGRHERVLSAEYIEVLGNLGYTFRMSELDFTVEVNSEPLNDALECEIRARLRDAGYEKVNVARDAFIAYAYAHRYHPIKNYLESQAWDGNDHIAALASYFTDEDGVFSAWLRLWLIGAVARVYRNGTQNRALVLDGRQDLGKSFFVHWLTSGLGGKFYIDSAIDPENKDDHIRLMNTWVWEIGELNATTGKVDRNALKQFLSREEVRVRVPYGRNDLTRPALTSFIATANNDGGFLNDPTGSRRFAACTLKSINWDYASNVDVNQVWAQAKHLFDAGEPWRFTGADQAKVNEINSRFEIENPIFSWLDEIMLLAPDGSATTTAILADLRFKGARGSDKALTGDIASWMKAHNIKKVTLDEGKNAEGKRVQRKGWQGVILQKIGPAERSADGPAEPEWG